MRGSSSRIGQTASTPTANQTAVATGVLRGDTPTLTTATLRSPATCSCTRAVSLTTATITGGGCHGGGGGVGMTTVTTVDGGGAPWQRVGSAPTLVPMETGGDHPNNGGGEATQQTGGASNGATASSTTTGVKCVLLGDPGVGKTSLVVSYTTNGYPAEHKPTIFDNYSVEVCVEDRMVRLQICDTGGQDEVDSLRRLCLPDATVIVLCFSVVHPASFRRLRSHWLPSLPPPPSGPALILVGCRCDQRHDVARILDLSAQGEQPVGEEVAQALAREMRAEAYVECSSLTEKNLKTVFDLAIWAGLRVQQAHEEAEARRKAGKKVSRRSKSTGSSSAGGGGRLLIGGEASDPTRQDLAAMKKSKSGWKKLLCVS